MCELWGATGIATNNRGPNVHSHIGQVCLSTASRPSDPSVHASHDHGWSTSLPRCPNCLTEVARHYPRATSYDLVSGHAITICLVTAMPTSRRPTDTVGHRRSKADLARRRDFRKPSTYHRAPDHVPDETSRTILRMTRQNRPLFHPHEQDRQFDRHRASRLIQEELASTTLPKFA